MTERESEGFVPASELLVRLPDLPEYVGIPRRGVYVGLLVEKEEHEAEYGDGQKTPEASAKVWLVGGRPGEVVNCVYQLTRLRFQKFRALQRLSVGDTFVLHVYDRRGSDGRNYSEMAFIPMSEIDAGLGILREAIGQGT